MTARAQIDACFWTDRCYWVREADGTETLIPMCIGAAIHPSGCTCDAPQSRIERAVECADIARREADRLRQKLRTASERASRLEAVNRELARRLREACE
jgi:hypothetical protein